MIEVHVHGSAMAEALAQELVLAGIAAKFSPLADGWWSFVVADSAKRLLPPGDARGVRYPATSKG